MRKYLTYPLLSVISIFISLLLSYFTGALYSFFSPISGVGVGSIGIGPDETMAIVGFFINYVFFLSALFTLYGGPRKYWFIGLFCAPYYLLLLLSLPGILVLLGYALVASIGCFLAIGLEKVAPRFVAKTR